VAAREWIVGIGKTTKGDLAFISLANFGAQSVEVKHVVGAVLLRLVFHPGNRIKEWTVVVVVEGQQVGGEITRWGRRRSEKEEQKREMGEDGKDGKKEQKKRK
jgi:hypothetical protein